MDFFYYIAGFGLLMLFVVRVMHWKNLLSMTLHTPQATSTSRKDIPDNIKNQLIAGEFELKDHGFEYSHCYRATEIFARLKDERWCVVLVHPEKRCFAEISNTMSPDADFPFKLNLYSFYDDGSAILTVNNEAHSIISHMNGFIFNDPYSRNINGIVESHFQRAERFKANNSNGIEPLLLSEAGYIGALNQLYKDYFNHLEKNNLVTRTDNEYRLRFTTVIKLTEQMLKGVKKVARRVSAIDASNQASTIKTDSAKNLVDAEVAAFRRHEQLAKDSKLSGLGKGFFFIISALLFAAVFGVTWSPSLLVIVVGVLLFHELGHIAGMWLFGYRDLQILFIPFMGALASGKKDNPTALQKAIVSLLGPLPGLILAFVLARIFPEMEIEWLKQTIMMLFIINYLNLLPLMPLDGGQLLNTVVFDRYPKVQFAFLLVSACLLAYGAWFLADPILTILAAIMGYSLLAQFNQAKLLAKILKVHAETDGENSALRRIFFELSHAPYGRLKFIQKYPIAKKLLERFQHRMPKLKESVFALVLYVVTLGAPIILMAPMLLQGQVTANVDDYWEKSIKDATSPEAKITALMNAAHFQGMVDDVEKTHAYYQQAVALSQNEPGLKEWIPLASLGFILSSGEPSIHANAELIRKSEFSNETLVQELVKLASYVEHRENSEKFAIELYEIAKQSYAKLGNSVLEAYLTITISNAYKNIPDFKNAEQSLLEGLELVRELDHATQSAVHHALAEFYFGQKKYSSAEDLWLQMLNELDDDEYRAIASSEIYVNLGWNALADKDFDGAKQFFAKSYDSIKASTNAAIEDEDGLDKSYALVESRLDLVALNMARNDQVAAKEYLNQAQSEWKDSSMSWDEFIKIQTSDIDDEEYGNYEINTYRAQQIRQALLTIGKM